MRIAHLSYANAAGVPQAFAQNDRDHGHDATCVAAAYNDFDYPCDHVIPEPARSDRYQEIVERADLVVAYDHHWYVEYAQELGRPVIFRGLGTSTYLDHDAIVATGVHREAVTIDLTLLGYRWQPMPVDRVAVHATLPVEPRDRLALCHAPSNRLAKGTERIRLAAQLANVQLDVVENLTHPRCLARKAQADALVDQVPADQEHPERVNGYGVNGLESMARAQPVLGRAAPPVREAQVELLGEVPYLEIGEPLPKALLRLGEDRSLLAEQAARGLAYISEHHDPGRVAAQTTQTMEDHA